MLVALTKEAKRRYYVMLPAFAGRLQNSVVLEPLKSVEQAYALADFYVRNAKKTAQQSSASTGVVAGSQELLTERQIRTIFNELKEKKFTQKQLLAYTANLQTSLIGLEACAGAHFLGRALRQQGKRVCLSS